MCVTVNWPYIGYRLAGVFRVCWPYVSLAVQWPYIMCQQWSFWTYSEVSMCPVKSKWVSVLVTHIVSAAVIFLTWKLCWNPGRALLHLSRKKASYRPESNPQIPTDCDSWITAIFWRIVSIYAFLNTQLMQWRNVQNPTKKNCLKNNQNCRLRSCKKKDKFEGKKYPMV